MKIPSIGNYLTEDKQTAIVEELGDFLCSGRIAHRQGNVFWNRHTGLASTHAGPLPLALSIVSLAPDASPTQAPIVTFAVPGIEVASEQQCEAMAEWVEKRQRPAPTQELEIPWYTLLAAGDTFQDEEGIVYTVVYVDKHGRADIQWFSPSSKRLLRSQEHLSDRWIASRSTPLSVAAHKAPQPPAPVPWRERILQLIETARRDPAGGARLISSDVTFYMECSKVLVSRESPKNVRHAVHLTSPEIIGAFKTRMTQLATEAARAHDDSKAAAIEALLE